MDDFATFFEGMYVAYRPQQASEAPPGFQPFGTIRLPGQNTATLYISCDRERLTAARRGEMIELEGIELVFGLAACCLLYRRLAATENDPRHRSKRRRHRIVLKGFDE